VIYGPPLKCSSFAVRRKGARRAGALVRKPAQSLGFDASVTRDQVEKTHPATHDDGALWLHRQPAAAGELI
jgi:hypothetical protein